MATGQPLGQSAEGEVGATIPRPVLPSSGSRSWWHKTNYCTPIALPRGSKFSSTWCVCVCVCVSLKIWNVKWSNLFLRYMDCCEPTKWMVLEWYQGNHKLGIIGMLKCWCSERTMWQSLLYFRLELPEISQDVGVLRSPILGMGDNGWLQMINPFFHQVTESSTIQFAWKQFHRPTSKWVLCHTYSLRPY